MTTDEAIKALIGEPIPEWRPIITCVSDAQVREVIEAHSRRRDPVLWIRRTAEFICAQDAPEHRTIGLNSEPKAVNLNYPMK